MVPLKIASFCSKGLKYCKFTRKRNKAKHVMKNSILKFNTTNKYIEYKGKNTELVFVSPFRITVFYFITKYWKTVSFKPSFGLSVEI